MRYLMAVLSCVALVALTACSPWVDDWPESRIDVEPVMEEVQWTKGWEAARQMRAAKTARSAASRPTRPRQSRTLEMSPSTSRTARAAAKLRHGPDRCDWAANLDRAAAGRPALWTVEDTGAWGRAQVPGRRIWIAPRTPCDKVYSVAVHEWTHHMQGVVYGDWGLVERRLSPYGGPEAVADCGALLLGATWIRYGCPGGAAIDVAAAILRGERV